MRHLNYHNFVVSYWLHFTILILHLNKRINNIKKIKIFSSAIRKMMKFIKVISIHKRCLVGGKKLNCLLSMRGICLYVIAVLELRLNLYPIHFMTASWFVVWLKKKIVKLITVPNFLFDVIRNAFAFSLDHLKTYVFHKLSFAKKIKNSYIFPNGKN